MSHGSNSYFTFAGFTLDLDKGRLLNASGDVHLRAKSFALLSYLVRHTGRVVPKDELLTAIWPYVTVTEDSLTQCVRDVRKALGPEAATLLRTLPRRGYLFAGDAPQQPDPAVPPEVRPPGRDLSASQTTPGLRNDGIAVLPFVLTHSEAPADLHLLDGLSHDVISRLARFRSFHVIARGSTFALRHLAADPQAAGRVLGVAYAVTGVAQMRQDRVQLRVELVRVASGTVVWTEDLTEDRASFTSLLAIITERIVQMVQLQVTAAETSRAFALPEQTLDAWEKYHVGLYDAFRFDPDRTRRALTRFQEATRLAPDFARAHAAQSFCHYYFAFSGVSEDRAAAVLAAGRSADEAMQADDRHPSANWAYGRALWLQGDPDGCLQHSQRAVDLCPSYAHAQYMIGFVETHGGDAQRGVEKMDLVLSLSPFDPFLASTQITRAIALVRLGQIEEAAAWAQDAARQPNAYPSLLAPAALILASAGRIVEARQTVLRLRRADPGYNLTQLYQSIYRMSDDVSTLFHQNAPLIGL